MRTLQQPYPLAAGGSVEWSTQPFTFPSPQPPPRAARLLDGRALASEWKADVRAAIAAARPLCARPPGLAVVLVGEALDSLLYVRRKRDACAAVGIRFQLVHLPETASQAEVLAALRLCERDLCVHGILVQLPLPPHLDEETVLEAVSFEKDVDGFHPLNIGRLSMRGRTPLAVPCTPKGLLEMLRRARIPVLGAQAVVLGNSNTVGTPTAMLLRDCGASTVTVCHAAQTADAAALRHLAEVARTADILVAAVGRPGMVRRDWIKPGATVLDVGINVVPMPAAEEAESEPQLHPCAEGPGSRPSAFSDTTRMRIVGDVAFAEACGVAGAITPVPGGVGPMTIAALLDNVLHSWLRIERAGERGYYTPSGPPDPPKATQVMAALPLAPRAPAPMERDNSKI